MTVDKLRACTVKDLAEMARKRGVPGWNAMRKDQLIRAITRTSGKSSPSQKATTPTRRTRPLKKKRLAGAATVNRTTAPGAGKSSAGKTLRGKTNAPKVRAATAKPTANGKSESHKSANKPLGKAGSGKAVHSKSPSAKGPVAKTVKPSRKPPRAAKRPAEDAARKSNEQVEMLGRVKQEWERNKNLAYSPSPEHAGYTKDRLVVMVRDPYWLHAYWELTRHGVQRAEAALGQEWHTAKPVLRLMEISNQGINIGSESLVRNILIHGGVNNWYVDVQDPPKTYRIDIGYLDVSGKFFKLASSNIVTTPRAGVSDTLDENWTDVAQQFEKIYAMSGGYAPDGPNSELQELFEERLRRPMGSPLASSLGLGASRRKKEFAFSLDAELIVYGSTEADARVTLQGDPVSLRPDGTFTVRFSLPDCRQIIPAVAHSADGTEQRTIVLAVERNTKTMEPLVRETEE